MGLFGKTKSVLVVDTAAVLKTKGVRGRAAPRQQLQLLRALSRVVQREKFDVTAVLVGEPLDKAPHNKVSEGVRVRYAKSDEGLTAELLKALAQAGAGGVLVAEDVALEARVIKSGGSTLRVSTFRKLLDDGMDSQDNQGGNGNNGGKNYNNRPPRNNRRDRDRGSRQNRNANQQSQPKRQDNEVVEEKNSGKDAISQMIDLVD